MGETLGQEVLALPLGIDPVPSACVGIQLRRIPFMATFPIVATLQQVQAQ
jgi:hypothetical protein